VCGIGGIIPKDGLNGKEAAMARRLVASLERRGGDAWGYFDGEKIYKEPYPFELSQERYTLQDRVLGKKFFLCHTRLWTRGVPYKNKNNHPFRLGRFVMAHNGHFWHADKFYNRWGIETDSFALLYWINYEYGETGDMVEAIVRGLTHVRGTYAVWLYDLAKETLYLFRNSNPIKFARVNGTYIFASDEKAINDAVDGLYQYTVKNLRPYTIYCIKNGKVKEKEELSSGLKGGGIHVFL